MGSGKLPERAPPQRRANPGGGRDRGARLRGGRSPAGALVPTPQFSAISAGSIKGWPLPTRGCSWREVAEGGRQESESRRLILRHLLDFKLERQVSR